MDHIKILKRSFEITRLYRVLWLFGILLALTSTGGGAPNFQVPNRNQMNLNQPFIPPGGFDFPREFNRLFPGFLDQIWGWISVLAAMVIVLVCFVLLLAVVSAVVRYISETALIRLVDGYESSGEKSSIRQGFRLGWSRASLYIFLIDLLIGVVTAFIFAFLFVVALSPLLVWLSGNRVLEAIGSIASAGMGMLVFLLAILVSIVISLLIHFIRRVCVLENLGVFPSMRRGFNLVRTRLGDVIVMGLLMFSIGFGYIIVMIPITLILVAVGAVIAGVPALLVGVITNLFLEGAFPWILAVIAGLPVLMLIIIVPSIFLGGLLKTFQSSTWTLVYRELVALENAHLETT